LALEVPSAKNGAQASAAAGRSLDAGGNGDEPHAAAVAGSESVDIVPVAEELSLAEAGRRGPSFQFRTLQELFNEPEEEHDWIAPPWVAAGAITEMDGLVKLAGKTHFALEMARAVVRGDEFLDAPTQQGPVVYLTEQGVKTFRKSCERARLGGGHPDFHVLFRRDTAGATWNEIVERSVQKCLETGAKLFVVDTLMTIAMVGDENDSGLAREVMSPLALAADRDKLGIFLIRHSRKEEGPLGISGRGSTAYSGEMDQLLSLRRLSQNDASNQRRIHTAGRLTDEDREIIVAWTPDAGYSYASDAKARQRFQLRERIFTVLSVAPEKTMKRNELRADPYLKTLPPRLYDEVEAAEIAAKRLEKWQAKTGEKGQPYYVRLLATTPPEDENDSVC
jgi:hypothetical protein